MVDIEKKEFFKFKFLGLAYISISLKQPRLFQLYKSLLRTLVAQALGNPQMKTRQLESFILAYAHTVYIFHRRHNFHLIEVISMI